MEEQSGKHIESVHERLKYEAREKAILNHNQVMSEKEEHETERLSKLFGLLVQDKRYDDLERAAGDDHFLQQIMLDYDI